jgi:hypothetical protein
MMKAWLLMMNERSLAHLFSLSYGVLALALVALLFWPERTASACACCAEPGTWFERTDRIEDYEREEIERLRFDAAAATFMTEAGEDAIKGLSNPADNYTLTLAKRRGRWDLRFRDEKGRTGTLTLTLPATITEFGVDLHDKPEGEGGETTLYKELRLTGALTGNGIFKSGSTAQMKYRLIFQGRGNNCPSADDFTHWQLQVFGPRASYSFYGKLKNLV